jgi:hypothetical protein
VPIFRRTPARITDRRNQRCGLEKVEIAVRPDVGEFVVGPGQIEDRHQHEDRSRHGEDEELDRCIDAAGPAPDADDEVHRDQGDLPEHVEQEKIEGHEGADHPGGQQKKSYVERFDVLDVERPRGEDDDRQEECGEEHEQQRDAVDTDVVVDA